MTWFLHLRQPGDEVVEESNEYKNLGIMLADFNQMLTKLLKKQEKRLE